MSWTLVPDDRVARIASRGTCYPGCQHRDCDAARLAHEVLVSRNAPPPPPAATGWWTRPRFSVEQAVFAWVGITVGRILYAILQKEW